MACARCYMIHNGECPADPPSAAQVRDEGAGPKVGSDEYYEALGDLVEQHPIGGHLRPAPSPYQPHVCIPMLPPRRPFIPDDVAGDAEREAAVRADERSRATREATGVAVEVVRATQKHYAGDACDHSAFTALGIVIRKLEALGPGARSPSPDAGSDEP